MGKLSGFQILISKLQLSNFRKYTSENTVFSIISANVNRINSILIQPLSSAGRGTCWTGGGIPGMFGGIGTAGTGLARIAACTSRLEIARIYLWILHVQKADRDVTRVPNIFWKMIVSEIWEFSLFLSDHIYRMLSVSIFDFFIFWVFKHRLFCCLSFELSIFW